MSMLKWSVFVTLVLCGLIPTNNAACYRAQLRKDATHCMDSVDKTRHAFGTSWTNSKCLECTCDPTGVSCCDKLPTTIKAPEDCEVLYNYDTCTYAVFLKRDPRIRCPHSASGK